MQTLERASLLKWVWRYAGLLALSGAIVALDQWTKSLLRARLAMGESWPPDGWIVFIFKIVRTENSGAAFSMGAGLGPVFMLLAIGVTAAILAYYPRLPAGEPGLHAAVGVILGGVVGNLIDRLTVGQVTDFIAIRYFAVVNVADISLTFGTAAVLLWVVIQERQAKKAPPEKPEE